MNENIHKLKRKTITVRQIFFFFLYCNVISNPNTHSHATADIMENCGCRDITHARINLLVYATPYKPMQFMKASLKKEPLSVFLA